MFNPLSPSEVVAAVGAAARDAARAEDPAGEFARGQLLSAASASRHLAVELAQYAAPLRAFVEEVVQAVADEPSAAASVARLRAAADPRAVGEVVCDLLDALRSEDRTAALVQVHAALRRLSDREVALLADAIEGPVGA